MPIDLAFHRVFILSPARIGGRRSEILFREEASFDAAVRFRQGLATVGEIYGFISGLYFRGKIAYSQAFGHSPDGVATALVIVPGLGLVPLDAAFNRDHLASSAGVEINENNETYKAPLLRDALSLNAQAGPDCRYVLLGSIATGKYTQPLLSVFGERLLFPADFVGRGDMSRGGLMLRSALSGDELTYVTIQGAVRRGPRVAKLEPRRYR